MNVELAKAGLYGKQVQKRVTMLADLRNRAAHGNTTAFAEVDRMITEVERFVSETHTA